MSQVKSLGHYLDHLHALIASQLFPHLGKALNGDFSFSQLNTLFMLYKQGSCSIADIADNASISHNAASRMVDRLVQGQYVTRVEDQHDRRLKKISLTVLGFEKLKELQIITTDLYNEILLHLPNELQHKLELLLQEIEPYLPQATQFEIHPANQVL